MLEPDAGPTRTSGSQRGAGQQWPAPTRLFWNGLDLHRKLDRFAGYYNQRRVHAGLGGHTPFQRCGRTVCQPANLHDFAW